MKVASVQVEIKDNETKEERIDRVCGMLDQLADRDLIILPEIWATGYFNFDRYHDEAETMDGPYVKRMGEKSKELGAYLFAGSFVEKDGDAYYNTSVLFNPQGEVAGTYRKIHLFRYGSKEGEVLNRGEGPTVVDTPFGKMGLTTCYDMRFPELYRMQVDMGAEMFLVTAAWPHQRVGHWNVFNVARALENQSFVISCNCVGNHRNVVLGGHSQIVDPWGVTMAMAGEREAIVKTEIDLNVVKAIRDDFPNLKHRVL